MQATFTKERLMPYREQGYSNAEIAKAVGCAYNTVVKVLGHQDRELTILLQKQGYENYKAMERIKKEYREKREREAKEEAERLERERLAKQIEEAKELNESFLKTSRTIKNYSSQANTYRKKLANIQSRMEEHEREYLRKKEQAERYADMCRQELSDIERRMAVKEASINEQKELFENARTILESNGLTWKTAL